MAGGIQRPRVRDGTCLLQRRVGANIIRSGWHTEMRLNEAKWGWPLGRLTLYRDRMEIQFLFLTPFVLSLSEIKAIKRPLARVIEEHTNEEIPNHVALTGWGLFDALKDAIRRSGLDLDIG